MQVICIELIGLYVWMFIPSVNEQCGHYFIVISYLVKPWFFSQFILLNRIVLVSYAITSFFFAYNDDTVLLCFRRFLII